MKDRTLGILSALAACLLLGGAFLTRMPPERAPDEDAAVLAEAAPIDRDEAPATPEAAEPPASVRVPILAYHNIRPIPAGISASDRQFEVPPEELDRQLAWLKEQGYESISFDALHAALVDGAPLPPKPIILSFDDGRDTHYASAFPLLRAYGFTATFFVFTNAIDRPGYLTWEQMREMRAAGMEFGSHTRYHAYLTRLTDPREIDAEISGSKKTLEDGFGEPIAAFAYPFGLHDDATAEKLRAAGYETARTIDERFVHAKDGLLRLGAVMPTEDFARFKRLLERARL